MNDNEYRDAPGINYSSFKHLRASPLHYQHKLAEPRKDMPAWMMGRLIHTLTFEPFTFGDRYLVWEGRKDKRTKAYQAVLEEAGNREVITPAEHEQGLACARAISEHPTVSGWLSDSTVMTERPLFWEDALCGTMKAKPDLAIVRGDHHVLVDLKTFTTTDPHTITRTAFQAGWHLQAAHYLAGLAGVFGAPRTVEAYLLIAEQSAPHDVTLFKWDELSLEVAELERSRLLKLYQTCTNENLWPGRGLHNTITPPAWLLSQHPEMGE